MKKVLVFTFAFAIFANACSTSKQIRKTVSQKYYNISFSPELITKKSIDNTEITVTPIDAKSLNNETYEAAFRDGNYEKEFISAIESWKSKLSSLPKMERIILQRKINAFDCLTKLQEEGKIPAQLSLILKKRIIDETSGKDGTEIESLADIDIIPAEYNPYKVNSNYFSVFKLLFDNKGKDIENINMKEFQLVSNEEQLYPLASEYFEKNLKDHTETIKNLYRMNMPNELIVTPGQRVSKYIAVPAINTENSKLQIQYIKNSNVVNFDFNVSKKEIEKTFNLEKYDLTTGQQNFQYKTFYVISFTGNVSYALKDNKIFVSDEKKSLKANVYAISISLQSDELSFGFAENFTFSGLKNNIKKIEFRVLKKDKKTGQYSFIR